MSESLAININELTSPTWNWLHVNSTEVSVPKNVIESVINVSPVAGVKYAETYIDSTERAYDKTGAGEEFTAYCGGREAIVGCITISEDVTDTPVIVRCSSEGLASLDIVVRSGVTATVVYDTTKQDGTFMCSDIRISIEDRADLTLIELVRTENEEKYIGSIGGYVAESAEFRLNQIAVGCGNVDLSCRMDLMGDSSSLVIESGYMMDKRGSLDVCYNANHFGRNTESVISLNGCLRDRAAKTFKGTIDFKRGSKGARGDEREDVLLVNEGVRNRSVPVILCSEEDVEGSHGASIGKVSDDIMFFLETRGVPKEEIVEMLAQSRIDAVIGRIGMSEARAYVREAVNGSREEDGE